MRQRKRVKRDSVDTVEEHPMLVPSTPPSSSVSSPPAEAAVPPPTPRGPALPPRPAWLTSPVSKDFYQNKLKINCFIKEFSIIRCLIR